MQLFSYSRINDLKLGGGQVVKKKGQGVKFWLFDHWNFIIFLVTLLGESQGKLTRGRFLMAGIRLNESVE